MRMVSVGLWAVVLTGCNAAPPRDCKVAEKQAFQCLERNAEKSARELLLACFPVSKPERISGAWVNGFETNEFYEGQRASKALIHSNIGDTQLVFEDGSPVERATTAYQVEITGRRSLCDAGFPKHYIVVERLISKAAVAHL